MDGLLVQLHIYWGLLLIVAAVMLRNLPYLCACRRLHRAFLAALFMSTSCHMCCWLSVTCVA